MKKILTIADLLKSDSLHIIMEAHNGLSARIAEAAGFPALWASGLSISTSMGLRDANEASWTEVLYAVDQMLAVTKIPILFDADTGFGNFNTFRRLVSRLCRIGVGGVVIEDKVYPKMNSFVGSNHSLAELGQFCGKLRAGKDAQSIGGFCLIARTEALIAGLSLEVALERCEQYRKAGADAIFVHSRRADAKEILDFARLWDKRLPLVVSPTAYPAVDPKQLEAAGVRIYICANQSLRASMKAMQTICSKIQKNGTIFGIDKHLTPLNQLFETLDYEELRYASTKYNAG